MYSSLDKIDITSKDKKGRLFFAQTDHRTSKEIENDRDMSVVFAIVRITNPMRSEKFEKGGKIDYICNEVPPLFFQQVIASAGGNLFVDKEFVSFKGEKADVEDLLNAALTGIARKEAKELKMGFDLESLEKYEKILAGFKPDKEKNEIVFWECVMKASAFAAEVLKKEMAGKWVIDQESLGALSIVFCVNRKEANRIEEANVNFPGKAMKFFKNGEGDSIASLVKNMPLMVKLHNRKDAHEEKPVAEKEPEKNYDTLTKKLGIEESVLSVHDAGSDMIICTELKILRVSANGKIKWTADCHHDVITKVEMQKDKMKVTEFDGKSYFLGKNDGKVLKKRDVNNENERMAGIK